MNLLSARELLERIDHCFPGSQRRWSFPFTYVDLVADDLPDDEDDREAEVARRLELSVAALRAHGSRLFLRIEPRRSDEPSELLQSAGAWWGRALQEDEGAPELVPGARVVHFYGYKGGQARSTLLAFLARALAADGWRALVVDVDAEAPSLDLLFDVRLDAPAASLVGARADLPIAPARVVTPGFSEGYADLLAFRPHGATWDQDAAALALEVGTSPHASSSLARRVLRSAGAYDVVLVDHRTGLSPTVLPWMEAAPGALVVFARLDRQWQAAREHLAELWRRVPASVGGAVISLAPPVPSLDAYRAENEPEGVELLDLMARALDPQGESLSGEQLLPQWIVWPHDPVFTGGRVPEVTQVGGPTRDRLAELRRVLGLSGRHERAERAPTHAKSGALDEGTLIVTRALRELSIPNNPYRIVIGRKGTGKTRLVRALVEQRLAEPLLVAPDADEATGGFNMSVEVKELERRTADDPEAFWWTLLRAALRHPRARRDVLLAALPRADQPLAAASDVLAALGDAPRSFIVDGLEVSFDRARAPALLDALISVSWQILADSRLRNGLQLRLCLRPDLAARPYPNFAQLAEGRTLDLHWDTRSIFNFALTRIAERPWFRDTFRDAVDAIAVEGEALRHGRLEVDACTELLLRVFPERLSTFNMFTATFLQTWFSNDVDGQPSYFPRIYDDFLATIARRGAEEPRHAVVRRRISDALIREAHDAATRSFLGEVREELQQMVRQADGGALIGQVLGALRGAETPFPVRKLAEAIAKSVDRSVVEVRDVLDRMKELGMFEDRPGHPGEWRAGRLFKTALEMKYRR